MRIRELTITNYRSFGDATTFRFSEHFSVIAGINGRGKTTILDGIALLLSRLLPHISPARSGYRKIKDEDIHLGESEAKLQAKLNCAGIPLDYFLKYTLYANKPELPRLTAALKQQIRNAYGDPYRADDQAPLVVYYTTDRAGYRFPKAMPQAVSSGQAMAYNGALFNRTVDYKDFIARYRVAESERHGRSAALQAINTALARFMDGFTTLSVETNPPRIFITKQGQRLDIRQLSDGERSFIALITDLGRRLALANPELGNPLHGAGVVLIDELELHLHPKWQLQVSEKLRDIFPNIQFIVTTHSPFILQTAREGETILLDDELAQPIDPAGKSLEEVARYVMDVENTEYSPRIRDMRQTAREYLRLAEEAKTASEDRREEIQTRLIQMLAPFSDNPAYIALLESKGLINPEQ